MADKETITPVYISCPAEDKLPKSLKPGHQLIGTIRYASKTPCKFALTMSAPQPKASTEKKENKPEKSLEEQFTNGADDFFSQWYTKLVDSPLEKDLMERFSGSLAAQEAMLNGLDSSKERAKNLKRIMDTARKIIESIDADKLLSYFGAKSQLTDEQIKLKEQMEKEKSQYINAIHKLGVAIFDGLLESLKSNDTENVPTEQADFSMDELDKCFHNLAKFVAATDAKMISMTICHALAHKHYGRAWKALMASRDENGHTKENYAKCIEVVNTLGYTHIVEYMKRWQLVRFPSAYELF